MDVVHDPVGVSLAPMVCIELVLTACGLHQLGGLYR